VTLNQSKAIPEKWIPMISEWLSRMAKEWHENGNATRLDLILPNLKSQGRHSLGFPALWIKSGCDFRCQMLELT